MDRETIDLFAKYIKIIARKISLLAVIVVTLIIIFWLMALDFLGIITPGFGLANSVVLTIFCILAIFFKPDIRNYHKRKAAARAKQ